MTETVIFTPGLGDRIDRYHSVEDHWRKHGFTPVTHNFRWEDTNEPFLEKYQDYLAFIDEYLKSAPENKVSLVNESAAGVVGVLALLERPALCAIINNCGMLRLPNNLGWRRIWYLHKPMNPVFVEALETLKPKLTTITEKQAKKVMTVRPKFGDQLVPADTVTLNGAYNIDISSIEHVTTIFAALKSPVFSTDGFYSQNGRRK